MLATAAQMKSGLLGSKSVIFIATPVRLIIAMYTKATFDEFMRQQKMQAKERGDNLLQRMGNTMAAGFTFVARYHQMPPQAILAENTENFFIPLEQVELLQYDDPDRRGADDSAANEAARVFIHAGGREIKLTLPAIGHHQRDFVSLMVQLLGERFKKKIFG